MTVGGIELSGEVAELLGEEMPVAVHRDVDARVSKVMLDRLRVNAATDQHRCAGVTQVMDPQLVR